MPVLAAAAAASRRGLSSLLLPVECRPRFSAGVSSAVQAGKKVCSIKSAFSAVARHRSRPLASLSSLATPSLAFRDARWTSVTSRCFSSAAGAETVVPVPSMGDSITEGSLNEWKKQPGEYVKEGELVAVIDTDKVSVDINAPQAGRIVRFEANAGDTVEVGKPLYVIDPTAQPDPAELAAAAAAAAAPATPVKTEAAKPVSPPEKSSVPQPAPSVSPPKPAPAPKKPASPVVAVQSPGREEKRVPMSRMRQRIAERLKGAQNTAAMLTTFNECDMGALMAMRSELNPAFQERHGVKMGFVSAFMLASAMAMKKVPEVNAFIEGNEIVYKSHVDISVAVATPTGLMVPVVRDCERKSWPELEKELAHLAVKARNNQIALEDMAGGTFTISNGGVYGSMMGTPILNPPQSSIL
ncbi:dihydrolipoyllysine-residue succinyltransferase component of oxoglutarate dehydrogenase, partial [Toxoplasma gondii p89]